MKKQAYQKPELRDENDKIVQEGTYGKHSPICSSTNDGIIDYINNNLEALHDSVTGSGEIETTNLTVTGETSVPTANVGNKSKAIANTEFVQNTVADLVNCAPDTLNTLDELAQALGDDPNFATTMATELGKKANTADVANTYLDKLSKTEQVVTAPIKGTLNGNATSATKLETARTINVTDADGTNTGMGASFDGTANATVKLPATIKANLTGNATSADYATIAYNDANGNPIAGTYLPLAGGSITGDVDITGDLSVTGSIQYVNNGKVFAIGNTVAGNVDLGWNWDNREGAGLGLRSVDYVGSNNDSGVFSLYARDANNTCSLTGKPNGSLTWGGKEIERINSSGTNYIRYESGLQMCWGGTNTTQSGVSQTYPVAFSSNPKIFTSPNGYSIGTGKTDITPTTFKLTSNNDGAWSDWLAIGYWK